MIRFRVPLISVISSAISLTTIACTFAMSKLLHRRAARRARNRVAIVSSSQANDAATDCVLQTSELLEAILAQLPMRDLLLAQRVCRGWKNCIDHSIHLKRLLFLVPSACGPVSWIDWRFDDKDLYRMTELGKPLRPCRGPLHGRALTRYPQHWGQSRDDVGMFQVFVNPLLAEHFPILSQQNVYTGMHSTQLSTAMREPQASWRKMFITQPVIETMFIQWDNDDEESRALRLLNGTYWTIDTVSRQIDTNGVTANQLLNRLQRARGIAWVEGSEFWKAFRGEEDLLRVHRHAK